MTETVNDIKPGQVWHNPTTNMTAAVTMIKNDPDMVRYSSVLNYKAQISISGSSGISLAGFQEIFTYVGFVPLPGEVWMNKLDENDVLTYQSFMFPGLELAELTLFNTRYKLLTNTRHPRVGEVWLSPEQKELRPIRVMAQEPGHKVEFAYIDEAGHIIDTAPFKNLSKLIYPDDNPPKNVKEDIKFINLTSEDYKELSDLVMYNRLPYGPDLAPTHVKKIPTDILVNEQLKISEHPILKNSLIYKYISFIMEQEVLRRKQK